MELSEEREPFNPSKYLIAINGSREPNYLRVAHRMAWFRSEHPDGHIMTELLSYEGGEAVFKATVAIPDGGTATGHGSETAQDFPAGPLEKAESKAIGRALAALGYGTLQAGEEFDEGAGASNGQMRIVDAPIDLARKGGQSAQRGSSAVAPTGEQGSQRATERQVKFIYAIAREARLDEQELAAWSQELYSADVDHLTRRDASALIEALQRRRNEVS